MNIVGFMEATIRNDVSRDAWQQIGHVMEGIVGRVAIQSFASAREGFLSAASCAAAGLTDPLSGDSEFVGSDPRERDRTPSRAAEAHTQPLRAKPGQQARRFLKLVD